MHCLPAISDIMMPGRWWPWTRITYKVVPGLLLLTDGCA
jgi:hypothetical protein